jgi:four helix bundle protein
VPTDEVISSYELYSFRSQLRRAAVSVPGSIAQGEARYSLVEIETELLIAKDLGILQPTIQSSC